MKIKIKRGLKVDLPTLDEGELGLCIDTEEVFIGTASGNIPFASKEELNELETRVDNLVISGGGTVVNDSASNGYIVVNGVEIQVYDDATLKNDLHTHSNLDELERLGINESNKLTVDGIELVSDGAGDSSISDSTTNGNILVNGSEVNVYDDSSIVQSLNDKADKTELHSHSNKTTLDLLSDDGTNLLFKGSTISGGGQATVLMFDTEQDLLDAYPNGTDMPAWVKADKSWYYWEEPVADTTAPTVTVSPSSGTYIGTQSVTLTSNESATIFYTTDGLTPTESSSTYNSAINISADATLKYFAKDSAGNTSTVQSATYTINIPDTTPPADVTNLVASNVAETSLTLSWTTSTSSDIASYDVYNGVTFLTNVTGTTYNVTNLSHSTDYTFNVIAKDESGNESIGASVDVTTLVATDTTPPENVTNLVATPSETTVDLSWTASASSDVMSYDVYEGANLLGNVTGTAYQVTGLTASTEYTFVVKAKDGSGNVASGESVVVTTNNTVDTVSPALTITPSTTFTDTQIVNMNTDEIATIWYTLDDTDPTTSVTRIEYNGSITLTETDTIKAYAIDPDGNASAVQVVTYTKELLQESPNGATPIPYGGTFVDKQIVTFEGDNVDIHYTLDGTTPTTSSPIVSTPINLIWTTTLKYITIDQITGEEVGTMNAVEFIRASDNPALMIKNQGWVEVPSITVDKIEITAIYNKIGYVFDSRQDFSTSPIIYFHNGSKPASVTSAMVNGINYAKASDMPLNQKQLLTITLSQSFVIPRNSYIFSKGFSRGDNDYTKGIIYDVKFYNSGTLIAHYDMTTGTSNDMSGNENHAVVSGAEWLL
jgi:chitodextrinase